MISLISSIKSFGNSPLAIVTLVVDDICTDRGKTMSCYSTRGKKSNWGDLCKFSTIVALINSFSEFGLLVHPPNHKTNFSW